LDTKASAETLSVAEVSQAVKHKAMTPIFVLVLGHFFDAKILVRDVKVL
jgi:hypothetical protein